MRFCGAVLVNSYALLAHWSSWLRSLCIANVIRDLLVFRIGRMDSQASQRTTVEHRKVDQQDCVRP